jgi:2-C-methyl-D-erythritol 4-phosphate cytidylyltransferase
VARLHLLIPCGGTGSRAGGDTPKQYQHIHGQALVWHTLQALAPLLENGTVESAHIMVAPDDTYWSSNSIAHINKQYSVVSMAGITRAQTVMNGLHHLLDSLTAQAHDWVLVHDAARCLITAQAVMRLIQACENDAVGGLLAQPLADTLKLSDEVKRVQQTLTRTDKWLAQTPQMFRVKPLLDALIAAGDVVTDEASAMELAGMQPLLVKGEAMNIKITYPEDFALAAAILKGRTHHE